MSIKKKLLFAISISFTLIFIIIISGWFSQQYTLKALRNAALVEQERMYLEMTFRGINEAILTEGTRDSINIASEGIKGFEKAHHKLAMNLDDPELRKVITLEIDPQWQKIKKEIVLFLGADNISMSDDHLLISYGNLLSELEILTKSILDLSQEAQRVNISTLKTTSTIVGITILVIIVGTVLVYINLFRSIADPIRNLGTFMGRISQDEEGLIHADALKAEEIKYEIEKQEQQLIKPVTDIKSLYMSFNDMIEGINNYRDMLKEKIHTLSYYDRLTGLPNRTFFKELLTRAITYASRYRLTMAVILIGLDSFKRINETLGHKAGDQLLNEACQRFADSLRDCDLLAHLESENEATTISRIGGDEFIIFLNNITTAEDAVIVARRLSESMAKPFTLDGHEVFCTVSIGISTFPEDGKDPDSLMKCSDAAMHHAKGEGKNNYQFYTETMNKVAYARLVLESELRRALERDEFLMYFQPKVNPENRKVVSMEALVRWQHPDRGFVSPETFIPLAEETGLIIPLGEWILRQCCKQNKAWQLEGFSPVRVAVNLSNRQFEQKNLLKTISDILQETQLAPEHLELEITESSIMKDPDSSVTLLQELKKTGISIAIDDFGTGHSSLHCLKQLPLDTLKVDRSFVINIIKNENDTAIAKAIIAMAKNLNLKVVAEGVEDEEQFALLRALGCDEIQGYLFSPPLPAHEFRKFLEKK